MEAPEKSSAQPGSNITFCKSGANLFVKTIKKDFYLYLLLVIPMIYFFIFNYIPMYGIIIAFKNFNIYQGGFFSGEWVGLKHFIQFLGDPYFYEVLRNTFILAFLDIIFRFPVPILLALSLNEVKNMAFKRVTQTVSYLPHFISIVIISGMIVNFLSPSNGLINNILASLGFERINFLMEPKWFRTIFVTSGIWKSMGWTSILFLAAISSIDPNIYEAARIDGANRFQQMRHITLQGIKKTAIVLLILEIGGVLNLGFEKVLLLYNPAIYETADILSTYIYRRGLVNNDFSYSTAVGLFNSVVSFIFVYVSNYLSRRFSETSLW